MKPFEKYFLYLAIFFFLLIGFIFNFAQAATLRQVSDTISTSWPATGADHVIRFTAVTPIPASGRIVITPQEGVFYIPSLNYNDLRFFINGNEQSLGSSAGPGVSGVEIVSGLEGRVIITLASDLNISSEDKIIVRVGLGVENRQIINPAGTGSYKIIIQTFNNLEVFLDTGTAVIAILDPVQVGAGITREEPLIRTLQAYVSDPNTAALYGALINLGSTSWGDVFFEYREKDTVSWQGTPKNRAEDPLIFSTLLVALSPDTVYEFRAGVEWLMWDEEESQFILTVTYGDILEFPTTEPDEAEEPQPPPPPPGVPPPSGVPASPPPPALLTPPPYVIFHGWAFPNGKITLLKENEIFATNIANARGEFRIDINESLTGIINFILQAEDEKGRKSIDFPFTIEADPSKVAMISNILFAPTIEANKESVDPGGSLEIFGRTVPEATIELKIINSEGQEFSESVIADTAGNWQLIFDSTNWKEDRYRIRGRVVIFGEESVFSRVLTFTVGIVCLPADLNCDGRVDVIDFSILMFYWGSTSPHADINGDGRVDIIDFSIMMAYWTG